MRALVLLAISFNRSVLISATCSALTSGCTARVSARMPPHQPVPTTATSIGFMSMGLSSGLFQGMRHGEGVDLHAAVVDAHGCRQSRRIAVEVGERADHLRGEADVGHGGCVAVAESAGFLLPCEVHFDRLERAQRPVRKPPVAGSFVLAHFFLKITPYTRSDERVTVGRRDEREAAHARATARIPRQE